MRTLTITQRHERSHVQIPEGATWELRDRTVTVYQRTGSKVVLIGAYLDVISVVTDEIHPVPETA